MATEIRVEGIGVGDKESGINRIMPAMTAGANRIARGGNSVGVLNVLPNNFKITGSNINSIGIGEGMASAYGYDLRNAQSQTLNGTPAASGNKYYFIIAEFDLTSIPAVFKIKLHDNGAGASYTPTPQDNLITSPNGKYNMPLYRLKVNTSGAIVEIQNWEALGVLTIGYTGNSSFADNYTDKGSLQKKFNALDEKNKAQDTKLNNLGFKQGTITSSLIDASQSWWAKEGNIVYGKIKANFNWSTQAQTLQNIGSDLPKPFHSFDLAAASKEVGRGWQGAKLVLQTNGNIDIVRIGKSNGTEGILNFEQPYFCYNNTRQKP